MNRVRLILSKKFGKDCGGIIFEYYRWNIRIERHRRRWNLVMWDLKICMVNVRKVLDRGFKFRLCMCPGGIYPNGYSSLASKSIDEILEEEKITKSYYPQSTPLNQMRPCYDRNPYGKRIQHTDKDKEVLFDYREKYNKLMAMDDGYLWCVPIQ